MGMTMRVSLTGYDALTDTNLDHFALYADQSNVLIKESTRGIINLTAGTSQDITHNLGYIPFFMVFVNDTFNYSATTWLLLGIGSVYSPPYFCYSNTSKLTIWNNSGNTLNFKYFIFYDQQV
jgi:hypothetical protein